jgi:hypothetical protein
MNQMPKLPRQGFGFDSDDRKVHEPSCVRREPARRRFLQLAAGGAFVGWIGTAAKFSRTSHRAKHAHSGCCVGGTDGG